jgi:hypothetical protein
MITERDPFIISAGAVIKIDKAGVHFIYIYIYTHTHTLSVEIGKTPQNLGQLMYLLPSTDVTIRVHIEKLTPDDAWFSHQS